MRQLQSTEQAALEFPPSAAWTVQNGTAQHRSAAEARSLLPGKQKSFASKDNLYRAGDRVHSLYLIRSGKVKLLSYLPNGRARIVRLHPAGHWLGLEGLVGQAYAHTAVAIDQVQVEYFPLHSLSLLERNQSNRYRALLWQWHGDLLQADRWIAEFSTGGIKARVARLLGYLAEIEAGAPADCVELLTVHEFAEILGVTPESVSRILADFKRSEILRRQAEPPREIYRIDRERLEQQAQD